jgi:acetyl/propionyl-CoA carboxylase alpha subunit
VSVDYYPMISKKLVVQDADREKSLNKLVRVLKQNQIAGVPTDIDLSCQSSEHTVNNGLLEEFADDVHIEEAPVLLYLENQILDKKMHSFRIVHELVVMKGCRATNVPAMDITLIFSN